MFESLKNFEKLLLFTIFVSVVIEVPQLMK